VLTVTKGAILMNKVKWGFAVAADSGHDDPGKDSMSPEIRRMVTDWGESPMSPEIRQLAISWGDAMPSEIRRLTTDWSGSP
jgi:hypothetical protein